MCSRVFLPYTLFFRPFQSLAPGSDVRKDIPKYRVWRDGVLAEEVDDITHLWPSSGARREAAPGARSDWVAFLLGCSFSFEEALQRESLPVRHLQESVESRASSNPACPPSVHFTASTPKNVPMYTTTLPCAGAGVFQGPLVVSMRPMTPAQVGSTACIHITASEPILMSTI